MSSVCLCLSVVKLFQDYGNKFNQIRHPDLFGLCESQKLILTPVHFTFPHYPLPHWIPKINIFAIWPTKMPLGSKVLSPFITIFQHLIWSCNLYCDPSDPKCATSDSHHSANMFWQTLLTLRTYVWCKCPSLIHYSLSCGSHSYTPHTWPQLPHVWTHNNSIVEMCPYQDVGWYRYLLFSLYRTNT